jgi:hypothetical protein
MASSLRQEKYLVQDDRRYRARQGVTNNLVLQHAEAGNPSAYAAGKSRQAATPMLMELWRAGGNDAAPAGNPCSHPDAGSVGATICANRGVSRGGSRCHRSPLFGVDLFSDRIFPGCVDRPRQDTAYARRLLRFLRGWPPRRRRCRQSARAGFCQPAAPLPARIMAGSRRPDAGHSGRLEYPGARATAVDVNLAAIGR